MQNAETGGVKIAPQTIRAIRARIRRSLADPRPALTGEEVDRALDGLFVRLCGEPQTADPGEPMAAEE